MTTDASHKTRMLWLTGMLHAFTHVYNVALLPLYLLIQRDFKLEGVGQATLLVTVMMTAYYLPSYPMGVLADRINRKRLLAVGLTVNALAFIGLAFSRNYGCALAMVILAGLGGSFYHPSATAMIARLFPVETGKALGLVGMGASAGFCLGPIYAGWRATTLEPLLGTAAWRRPVLELGIFGILATALFVFFADNERPLPASERKSVHGDKLFPTLALWFFFILCAFIFSLRDFGGSGMASLGSLFLQKARSFDARQAGIALCGLYLASIVSNPLFGGLSDRGRKRWTGFVLLVSAVWVALFPCLPANWTIPCFIAFGFFFLPSYPMTEAAVMQSVPDAVRRRVYGLFITAGGLIGNLAHWVVGAQVERMGGTARAPSSYYPLYGALAALMLLSLAGLPCLHAIRKREHREETGSGFRVAGSEFKTAVKTSNVE